MKRFAVMMMFALVSCAHTPSTESDFAVPWCDDRGGVSEFVLQDRTRVDCLTDAHAVEVDWAEKWAESIGQALHYARSTGHAPGVLLILKKPDDQRFAQRVRDISQHYGLDITVWTVRRY